MKIKKGSICVIAVLFVASLLTGCNKKEEEAKPVPSVELKAYEKEYANQFLQVVEKIEGKTLFDVREMFSEDVWFQPMEELYKHLTEENVVEKQIQEQNLTYTYLTVQNLKQPSYKEGKKVYDKATVLGAYNTRLYTSYWLWDKEKKNIDEFYWIFAGSKIDEKFGGVILYPYQGNTKQKYSYLMKYLLGSDKIQLREITSLDRQSALTMTIGTGKPNQCTGVCEQRWDSTINEFIFLNDQ